MHRLAEEAGYELWMSQHGESFLVHDERNMGSALFDPRLADHGGPFVASYWVGDGLGMEGCGYDNAGVHRTALDALRAVVLHLAERKA